MNVIKSIAFFGRELYTNTVILNDNKIHHESCSLKTKY